jgi:hypothetical protein
LEGIPENSAKHGNCVFARPPPMRFRRWIERNPP